MMEQDEYQALAASQEERNAAAQVSGGTRNRPGAGRQQGSFCFRRHGTRCWLLFGISMAHCFHARPFLAMCVFCGSAAGHLFVRDGRSEAARPR